MKTKIESKVLAGFLTSLLIIVLFSVNTFFEMTQLIKENEDHNKIQKVLKSMDDIKYNLIQMESAGRAYALVGNEKSHLAYLNSINQTREPLLTLHVLLGSQKDFLPQIDILNLSLGQFIKFGDKIIEAKHTQGTNAALALLLNGKFAEYGNKIILALKNMESIERNKLTGSMEHNIKAANNTITSFWILIFIVLVVLSFVYYLFKRDLRLRKQFNYRLSRMNEELENRIKIRTEALIKNEKRYRLLADNVLDVISLHSIDGNYIYASDSLKKMAGYEPSEVIGKSGYEYVHPDDIAYIREVHRNILTSNPHVGVIPFRFRMKDGNYLNVESVANIIYDATGNFESFIVCMRDASERVKSEKTLKANQQMIQSILDNTSSLIFIRNLGGEYLLVNKQFENTLEQLTADHNSEGMKEKFFEEVFPAEIFNHGKDQDHELLNTCEMMEFELQYPIKGKLRHFNFTKFPLLNDKQEVYAICGIATDITPYKLAQKEILDSKAKLRAVLQNSIDPIWSVGRNFELIDFNESCRYMGDYFYGKSISLGIGPDDMFNADVVLEWKECYKRTLSGEYFSKEMKLVNRMEDYYYDVSFNPITVNEQIEGIAVFARDITAHKKTEKQLSYKVNELNTFMYKATHDLRSPLVSLIGLVQLAQSELTGNSDLKQYFDMIGKSVAKMDKLLVDLVSITNVSQGKINIGKIDFNKMINDILESLKHTPDFKTILIKKKIGEKTMIHTDEKLLYSVLQNLIDNAIKYRKTSPEVDSTIVISVEENNGSVTINVSDNGIGIPQKFQDKVFDMFYRATNSSIGTGLGLYIVKNAVEKMGGKVSLSSQESGGTSIYINLPDLQMEANEQEKMN